MAHSCVNAAIAITLLIISSVFHAEAQISTPCTTSMISSFTPCINYLTGSTGSGSSPTKDCCNSLKSLMTDNMDCACLIVTGNVPVSMPFINANLGISLPRICKSTVPLQCTASGVPLPAPGPVLFGPPAAPQAHSPAPHRHSPAPQAHSAAPQTHAQSPKGSKAVTAAVAAPPPAESFEDIEPAAAPPKFSSLGPSANPGIRPVVNPKSASSAPILPSFALIFVGIMTFELFY